MGEKVTVMVLKVDLQCPCCYKKVKKILCSFPQIRDQAYNEKANTVTITVVCCNPEKLRDKLCCKGAKVIISIEIKEPKVEKPPDKKPNGDKPKVEKPPDRKPDDTKPEEKKSPTATCCEPCSEGYGGSPCYHGHGVLPPQNEPARTSNPPPPKLELVPCPDRSPTKRTCCGPCSEGDGGGPCSHGYGVPPQQKTPPPSPPKAAVVPCLDRSSPRRTCCGPCSEGYGGGPCYHGHGVLLLPNKPERTPPPSPRKTAVVPCPERSPPRRTYCGPCSEGDGWGPCYHGYVLPPLPQPCYDGCYGYGHSYGSSKPYHVTRCDYYFSEENPGACAIV